MRNPISRYTFYKHKYGSGLLADIAELRYVKKLLAESAIRTLDYYDITFITEGKGAFSVDNQTYEVVPCDVLFSKPGGIQSWDIHYIANGYALTLEEESSSFPLRGSLLIQHLSFPQIESPSSLLHLSDGLHICTPETLHDIKMEIGSYQQGDVHVLRILSCEVLMLPGRTYLRMTPAEEDRSREASGNHVDKFMNLVATHAEEQRPVQYCVGKLYTTPNYLNEMITSIMGIGTKQYIQGKVMEEAKRLLVYIDFLTANIAFEFCFSTVSYFIRNLRQHTGETPLLYRKTRRP